MLLNKLKKIESDYYYFPYLTISSFENKIYMYVYTFRRQKFSFKVFQLIEVVIKVRHKC